MLELVISILLALGFFILATLIYRSNLSSDKGLGLLVASLSLIGLSILLTIISYGLLVVLKKFIGLVLVLFGLFMVIKFPMPEEYQPSQFSKLGLLIGFFSFFLGVFLLLF
jgi:hypothetical protein